MSTPALPPSLVERRSDERQVYELVNAIRALLTTSGALSTILDMITDVRGSVLFRGATVWEALPPGTAGWRLTTNGVGADPTWAP